MSDKTAAAPFAPFAPFAAFAPFIELWSDAMRGQVARASSLSDEVSKMERAGLEHLDMWMTEGARLQKAQLAYAVELGSSMRKLGVEAVTAATTARA